jgi:hypothetical protein
MDLSTRGSGADLAFSGVRGLGSPHYYVRIAHTIPDRADGIEVQKGIERSKLAN